MTPEQARQVWSYDPKTGHLTWRESAGRGQAARNKGDRAGSLHKASGYRYVTYLGKAYREHRLVWFVTHGYWPPDHLDHINRDRADNRLGNLRLATNSENSCNRPPKPGTASGLKGVYPREKGRWEAKLKVAGRKIHLGRFDTKEEAARAYAAGAARHHGEFARTADAPNPQ